MKTKNSIQSSFKKLRGLTVIQMLACCIGQMEAAVQGFPVNFTTSNYTSCTVNSGDPAKWTSNKTLSTNTSGVYFTKQNKGAYHLFTIPVRVFAANDSITVTLGSVKVSNNNYKMTFKMQYSLDNSTYTDFGETWTESTTAVSIERGVKIPSAIASGNIYIKILSTSGGGTNGGNHYIKTADITYSSGSTNYTLG